MLALLLLLVPRSERERERERERENELNGPWSHGGNAAVRPGAVEGAASSRSHRNGDE